MKRILTLLLLSALSHTAPAQQAQQGDLYRTILAQDSLLFRIGFNTCDLRQFDALLAGDFEFYHDIGGRSGRQKFLADLHSGLCKDPAAFRSRRELLPGTTAVYPLYGHGRLFGAVQYGRHRFFERQAGKPETAGSTAQFTHLWLLEGGVWKLSRALSYDHQDQSPLPAGDAPPLPADDDAAISQWLKESGVPALGLGVIEHGALRQVRVFGGMKEGVPAAFNTLFNVASLTKPVTALVALRLASQGRWSLDAPLYRYYTDPDIAHDPRHRQLNTRLVLSHRTGFPNWRRQNPGGKLAFSFDPGTAYQYSGEGFEYLRKALERRFHTTLDRLAAELIFRPWHMPDTRFTWYASDTARVAVGYGKDGHPYPPVRNRSANAADDLLTTVGDYGSFLVHVLQGDGLSPGVFKEMSTPQVRTKEHKYFGLGFELYDLGNGDYALSHGGADKGVQTIVFLIPKTGQGLLLFTNVDDGWKVYEKLLVRYLGENGRKIIDIEMK